MPWLALGGLVLSILAGWLLPIYTDEIGWRFAERAAIDGGVDIMPNDTCGPNTIARAPWFMMPVRWFSAVTNQALADPVFVRGEGVACALAWIALFWVLIGRLETDGAKRAALRTLAFSLLGLGVLPYVLVLSRPEQPLILATTLILLLAFARLPRVNPILLAWLKAAGVVVLSTVMLSYHLKGVLYVVVAAGCLVVSTHGRGTLAPRVVGVALIGALLLVSAEYWTGRFRCPGDPVLAAALNGENVASVWANGGHVASVVAKMISGINPLAYVALAAPNNYPGSDWMLPGLFPWTVIVAVRLGMLMLWGATIILSAAALSGFLLGVRRRAFHEPRTLIALGLLGLVLVWGASQLNKAFYETEHILPSLAILAALSLTLPEVGDALSRFVSALSKVALSFALCSELVVLGLIVPPMAASAHSPGYISRQPYSIAAFGYPTIRRDIAAARAASGMPTDRSLERPLIDELTYLALQGSHLPLQRLGVLSIWNGSITDPVRYLLSRNSDGVIIGCHLLPPEMRSAASRSGEICAISRAGLMRLAASKRNLDRPITRPRTGSGRESISINATALRRSRKGR
jgi:hypothetical protein